MQRHNLNFTLEEEFLLIAIHSNIEAHTLAFLINKFLNISLKRKRHDLDFIKRDTHITYPIFEYIDTNSETIYYLIANKCKTQTEKVTSVGSLFASETEEKIHYLVPEYKQTDFLLKVVFDDCVISDQKALAELSRIPKISTYYEIDQNKLKSKQNLNFD